MLLASWRLNGARVTQQRTSTLRSRGLIARLVRCGMLALIVLGAGSAAAQQPDPMLLHGQNGLTVRGHFQAGLNLVGERNLFWDLARTFAPASGYDPDKVWLEGYIKPGLSFEKVLAHHQIFYGKASAVLSGTRGIDAYDTGNTGRLTLEEAYLGYRVAVPAGVSVDFSGGARELVLGTGMLIANGGSSGFERGALKFGPRKAWERAGIARLGYDGLSSTTFYLDPNETETNDSRTTLAGTDIRYDGRNGGFIGLTYGQVIQSESAYPKAASGGTGPPSVLPGARDGLNFANLYARTDAFEGSLRGLFFTGDIAYQWNKNIDLTSWGGRLQGGYRFETHTWRPSITYTFQTFSGDDPSTSALERFDPLFFDGSPATWATGSKSAMTFINSNVHAHQLALSVSPTERDTFTLRYAHIRANELRSPVQFGQATRFDLSTGTGIVAGVTDAHLADDVFLEYFRVINKNMFLTAGVSASFPGRGLELVVPDTPPVWLGGFVNVVVNY